MQGRDRQVAGFGEGQCMLHGLAIANLANQDNVRCLPQRVFERGVPAAGVNAHLALADKTLLVLVHELHRVFYRDDVTRGIGVAMVDQCRQGGRFARAGATNHEYQATLGHDGVGQHRGQIQV